MVTQHPILKDIYLLNSDIIPIIYFNESILVSTITKSFHALKLITRPVSSQNSTGGVWV